MTIISLNFSGKEPDVNLNLGSDVLHALRTTMAAWEAFDVLDFVVCDRLL